MKNLYLSLILFCIGVGTMNGTIFIDQVVNNSGYIAVFWPQGTSPKSSDNAVLYSNSDSGDFAGSDTAPVMYNLPYFVAPGHKVNLEHWVLPTSTSGSSGPVMRVNVMGTPPSSQSTSTSGGATATITCGGGIQVVNAAAVYDDSNGNAVTANAIVPQITSGNNGTQSVNVGSWPGHFSGTLVINADSSVSAQSGPNWAGTAWPSSNTWP